MVCIKMVKKTQYPGWYDYPVYSTSSYSEYQEICKWMNDNRVENFLLSSGSGGYIFQVKSNHEWFILRWCDEIY